MKSAEISQNKKEIIILLSACVFGLLWGAIYLFFADLHEMTQMFNNTFIFFTAYILDLKVKTKTMGFLFSFIDGFLFGLLFGAVLIRIIRNYLKNELS
ncbi:hypothetical protein BMS3Abin04_01751 [bacterium BMS3Abin04]|nr:hypothetical protein BMS3Abin04_01751 [bacterium BMS3Abin04]